MCQAHTLQQYVDIQKHGEYSKYTIKKQREHKL